MIDDTTFSFPVLHAAADATFDGDGSASRPLRCLGGDLDVIAGRLGAACRLVLKPGGYVTNGLPAERLILDGQSRDTVLALKPNAVNPSREPSVARSHLRVIYHKTWAHVLIVKNITLDGNFHKQDFIRNADNFKIEPLAANVTIGKAENVRVINFGAAGKLYAHGLEAFPLSLQTYCSGAPFQYFPAHRALIGKEAVSCIEIRNCAVTGGHFMYGGYCTAIFVRTSFGADAGDRQPFGIRRGVAALIAENVVSVPGGIAYGLASSEQVTFVNNMAVRSKAAVNIDTGEIVGVRFRQNQFLECNQGIRIIPHPNSREVEISRNVLTLTEPYFNSVLGRAEPFYDFWIAEKHITGLKREDNYVQVVGPRPRTINTYEA